MNEEQSQTVEAIKFAIQMEIDGKEYYRKASRQSDNEVGTEFFKWLANEEDKHRRIFAGIYNALRKQKAWPEASLHHPKGAVLETIFSREMKAAASAVKATGTELESIVKAMEMENKTREFYQGQDRKAVHNAEKKLYSALAAEEEGHYLALVDYREYLIDPSGYFRKAEHHSLDGG